MQEQLQNATAFNLEVRGGLRQSLKTAEFCVKEQILRYCEEHKISDRNVIVHLENMEPTKTGLSLTYVISERIDNE